MKRTPILFLFWTLLITFMFFLSACSDSNKNTDIIEEDSDVVDNMAHEPEPPTPYELLQQSTGLQDFDNFIYDSDWQYTIQYQRNLVGNTYLTQLFESDFDILEANGKLYLDFFADHDGLLEITEEQYNQILNHPDHFAVSFRITTVVARQSYSVEAEVDYSYYYDASGNEEWKEIVDEDSISAYPVQSWESMCHGMCLDVYPLE